MARGARQIGRGRRGAGQHPESAATDTEPSRRGPAWQIDEGEVAAGFWR